MLLTSASSRLKIEKCSNENERGDHWRNTFIVITALERASTISL